MAKPRQKNRVTKRSTTTRVAKRKGKEVTKKVTQVIEESEIIEAIKAAEESELSEFSELSELSDTEPEFKDLIIKPPHSLIKDVSGSSSVAITETITTKSNIITSSSVTKRTSVTFKEKKPRSKGTPGEFSSSSKDESKKKKKKKKQQTGYAPPEKYAHLGGVTDAFAEDLICVFVGLNPGIATAMAGHAYAYPRNHFWKLLHSSGLTPDRQCPPELDVHLPRLYSLGNTNLVARATEGQSELSKEEMDAGVSICEDKIRKWKPESVCIVGKGIWESIWRARHGGKKLKKEEFEWGWQVDEERFGSMPEEGYLGARVFVVPSTSGLVAGYSMEFKRDIWKVLGDWVQQRRAERGESAPREQVDVEAKNGG